MADAYPPVRAPDRDSHYARCNSTLCLCFKDGCRQGSTGSGDVIAELTANRDELATRLRTVEEERDALKAAIETELLRLERGGTCDTGACCEPQRRLRAVLVGDGA